jgi:para-nitrobenzyl esterase
MTNDRTPRAARASLMLLGALLGAPLGGCLESTPDAEAADPPIVATAAGRVLGAHLPDPGVFVFRGVPYGESTAGDGRFRAPRPVASWEGVRDATAYGPVCPQGGEVGRQTAEGEDLLPMSEDCLVLNVWTPALDGGRRPVMVWYHGRGFYAGAGSEPLYEGARLARRGDVVVVTVNHRLNVFGYLHLAAVGGEEFATSGNAGVQDMQLSLEWVRDNIAAFGGDPSNVTVFGESGGGAKVSTLLGVPSVRGLFTRGIVQSGSRLQGTPAAVATRSAETVMSRLGVTTVAELQAVPMETLLAAVTTTGRTTPDFAPVVDGRYLPADMFVPAPAASAHGIPVMIGSNRDEHALYAREHPIGPTMTEAQLIEDLRADFGGSVEELLAAYRASRPGATPWQLMIAIRSNRFHIGAIRQAEAQSKVAPVYLYSFDYDPTGGGAAHGAEIRYVLSNASAAPTATSEVRAVENAMSEAWIAFARTGSPDHAGLPEWPTYDASGRAVMVFDAETRVVSDLRSEERLVWVGRTLVR